MAPSALSGAARGATRREGRSGSARGAAAANAAAKPETATGRWQQDTVAGLQSAHDATLYRQRTTVCRGRRRRRVCRRFVGCRPLLCEACASRALCPPARSRATARARALPHYSPPLPPRRKTKRFRWGKERSRWLGISSFKEQVSLLPASRLRNSRCNASCAAMDDDHPTKPCSLTLPQKSRCRSPRGMRTPPPLFRCTRARTRRGLSGIHTTTPPLLSRGHASCSTAAI